MIIYPVKQTSAYNIGGKAKGLLQLLDSGLSVPDFLVIPAENFSSLLTPPNEIKIISEQLLNFSLNVKDEELFKKVLTGWNFPERSVIVRSSIADEDGTEDTFAGIMDSYSNLTSYEEVLSAIGKCAASAYQERAVAYRKQKGLSPFAQPAVIVQQQIIAEVSGIVFSTYPQYPQEMAIHATWGLGEGIVGGEMDPDEFYLLKKTGTLSREKIAQKEKMVTADACNGSLISEVKLEKQNKPCLSDEQLKEIFHSVTLLEQKLGHPLDLEFAIADNRIRFVQARPITQKIPEIIVYDNSNIQESYCGVTTPLTFSFAQRAYATVYQQTMSILSLSESELNTYKPIIDNLLGLIKGRIYYNINNWYRGLQLLPSFKQNKEDMERMMGVEEPVDFVIDINKSFWVKLYSFPSLLGNLFKLLSGFIHLKHSVAEFRSRFKMHYSQFYQKLKTIATAEQMLIEKKLLDTTLLQNWTTPIINDFYVMMTNGKVRRKLIRIGFNNPEEFISRYFSGNQQIESTQPVVAMQALAKTATANHKLKSMIINLSDDVHREVQEHFPLFYTAVDEYIHIYGDRTVGELKLETVTMRLSPTIFYRYLRNYLISPEILQAFTPHLRQSAKIELEQKLHNRSWLFKRSMHRSLRQLQEAIQNRESMRLERTRLFGMYRALYLVAGDLLQQQGKLKDQRDVFYLEENEIEKIVQQNSSDDIAYLVEERKKTFAAYKLEDLPSRVIIPSPPDSEITENYATNDTLQGTGCVQGNVTGEIILITSPEDDLDVSGKIICALRTDPGWVTLFPACKGVLIEKGSALSHSVILLREFGIPAIINIPGLTKKLQSGHKVTMNGTNGEIKITENVRTATDII